MILHELKEELKEQEAFPSHTKDSLRHTVPKCEEDKFSSLYFLIH